jgi:hypothetical protein
MKNEGETAPLDCLAKPLAAGGWDDSIHSQVLYHLPVVIHGMSQGHRRDSQTSHCAIAKGVFDRGYDICLVDGIQRFVQVGERIVQ